MNFSQAQEFYYGLIPASSKGLYRAGEGLGRMKLLLKELNNPQETFKSIHIAGTSGKGSTASILSKILKDQGFLTGTVLSPHLVDLRERAQINCKLMSKADFIKYTLAIKQAVQRVSELDLEIGPPTYFEALVALAYYTFSDKHVDYAIIETGLGGTYDGTNTISRTDKLSIITRIGLDHTEILGSSLAKITAQKAGIILPDSQVIGLRQNQEVDTVLRQRSLELNSELSLINKDSCLTIRKDNFDILLDKLKLRNLETSLVADYQKENILLALSAVELLASRDNFEIEKKQIQFSLASIGLPGRMDFRQIEGTKLIIDGAHNPQKMNAFLTSLVSLYPGEKFNFLIGFKHNKDHSQMLDLIIPNAKHISICNFFSEKQDLKHISAKHQIIQKYLDYRGYNSHQGYNSLKEALNDYKHKKGEKLIITGSLYLVGELYELINVPESL